MYDFYGGFGPYVPVWKRRQRAAKKIVQLKKSGHNIKPVVIEGRAIATTFWGKAWCDNLETYSDFASRLPRGRTYARNGSVIDLQIAIGKLTALVSGSEIYNAKVNIRPLPKERWRAVVRECSGKIDSLVELLTGKLSRGVMEVLCRPQAGLFPTSKEISLSCSCPDGAWLCKHLAAVLYGVGARLDQEPELLFVLRGVDQMDLISEAGHGGTIGDAAPPANVLKEESLSGIFGIEMDGNSHAAHTVVPRRKQAGATVSCSALIARGLRHSVIQNWLRSGILLHTRSRGLYLKTRETEARIEKYLQRIPVPVGDARKPPR
jgi:uncharacterized Zn finger protein